MNKIPRGLGKGLAALITENRLIENPHNANQEVIQIALENIIPNNDQPRKFFSQEELYNLAESIKAKGVLQPLLVRKLNNYQYQLIAGERRLRASKLAKLTTVPCLVGEFSDREVLELAIIENVQRQNLSPIEEARSFQKLIVDFNYKQEDIAKAISKSRSHIANLLRLLALPDEILEMIDKEQLTMGHARALINCENATFLAQQIVAHTLSVRQTEALVKKQRVKGKTSLYKSSGKKAFGDNDLNLIIQSLEDHLKMKIKLAIDTNNQGALTIKFENLEELDQLVERLGKSSVTA